MREHARSSTFRIRPWPIVALLIVLVGLLLPSHAQGGEPLGPLAFNVAAPQGLNAADPVSARQNSWPWSMQWFKGHLYVGTNRAYRCATEAQLAYLAPTEYKYPPDDPDLLCPPDPLDLRLQAEIWRWSPPQANDTDITDDWQLVYKAPADVAIPGTDPVKFVARDIGYRGMSVFREPNGTEALYVSSVSPRGLGYYQVTVPPRILRSTDGLSFAPVPQVPGTFLGDFPQAGYRDSMSHNGRFYVVGTSIKGSGVLLESANPAAGNNTFREVGPPQTLVISVASFNGSLYIGTDDAVKGYRVLKTNANGILPYTWTEVVPEGGGVEENFSPGVASMHVFKDGLYAGTDGGNIEGANPAELIRINPDDTWDLIMGNPRDGKVPLSGYGAGFGDQYNQHIWRMTDYDDHLYVGTYDSSINEKDDPRLPPDVLADMGGALYRSADGNQFDTVTIDGFDRPSDPHDGMFNMGVRQMAATPYGLFVGMANNHYGLNIYRGGPLVPKYQSYLPIHRKR